MNETTDPVEEAQRDIANAKLHNHGRGLIEILRGGASLGAPCIRLSADEAAAILHVIDTNAESHVDTAERYIACRETLQSIAELIPEGWEPRPWGYETVTMPDALVAQIKRLTEAP